VAREQRDREAHATTQETAGRSAASKAKCEVAPNVNVTSFISEFPPNVTPSKAEMVLDIRTTEDWSNRKLKSILKRLKLKYKVLYEGAMLTNKKVKQIQQLRKIADRVVGKKRKYVKSCGSTDARFFSAKGIPVAVIGPTGDNHHKHNEYVEIEALGTFYRILKTYIKEEVVGTAAR
jgi:acetylornithine deacetylase/succinyl-diaminopimelate desuccinylase-like protein